ncbi:hypothetical protein GALL_513330 [mine drainage metagenome]|uniref:Uncharacterized protein n=1 Tax=mine drainage metagenome TaxID=410659 RepID=A0A1J5P8M6_9ZZZZ
MRSSRNTVLGRLEAELADLAPPALPRPVPPMRDPAYQAWRQAFEGYMTRKAWLEYETLNLRRTYGL